MPVITVLKVADGNTILSWTDTGALTGTISGPFTDNARIEVHSNGTWNFQGVVTCAPCVVGSRSGTLTFRYDGRGIAFGASHAKIVIVGGTGQLANLHGQGTFDLSLPGVGTYSGRIHFGP